MLRKNNPYIVHLTHAYWITLHTMARYMRMMGSKRMIKIFNEKLIIRIVCILMYLKLSFIFLSDKSQLLSTASYGPFPSKVMIYLVYILRQFIKLITPNRRSNKKIVKLPCIHPETAILRTVSQYTVGEMIRERIPYSNIGKKFSLHFLSAPLMLLSSSLR